jgi:flagellar biosynthesis protein
MPMRGSADDARAGAGRLSAVALSHAHPDQAPVVVAKGYGAVAEAIVERAKGSGLYVHASPELVKLLMHVDLDARIPPPLYVAVAEVLAWLYQMDAGLGRGKK